MFNASWLNGDDFGIGIAIFLLIVLLIAMCTLTAFRFYKIVKKHRAELAKMKKEMNKEVFNRTFRRLNPKSKDKSKLVMPQFSSLRADNE